jgi:hypothetical protein
VISHRVAPGAAAPQHPGQWLAGVVAVGPQRTAAPPENCRQLALGTGDRDRLGPGHRPAPGPLTSTKPVPAIKVGTQGPWNPGNPACRPGHRHTPHPKFEIHDAA